MCVCRYKAYLSVASVELLQDHPPSPPTHCWPQRLRKGPYADPNTLISLRGKETTVLGKGRDIYRDTPGPSGAVCGRMTAGVRE